MILSLAPGAARGVELTSYGYGNARTGTAGGHLALNAGSAHGLHRAWVAHLRGAIDGEPLIVHSVGRHFRNLVIAATEHGQVAAIVIRTGKILWHRRLRFHTISPSCQATPDGYFGVTGTMVVDKRARRVYAVDVSGRAWALDLLTGRTIHGWPVRVHGPGAAFDWGALALSRGWLYVPIASLCDRGLYDGGVRAIDVAHPKHIIRWDTTAHTHSYAGGVWGWGGESIDSATGDVFVSTGNSIGGHNEHAGNAERVVKLSPKLKVIGRNYPLRPPYSVSDRDFGTAPVLINARGCQPLAVAFNKIGWLYLYRRNDIARGPIQSIHIAATTSSTIPLYGMAAYDPAARRLVMTTPTAPGGEPWGPGLISFVLSHRCRLSFSWHANFDRPSAGGPPIMGGGVVFIGTGRNGLTRAYDERNGRQLWSAGTGSATFAAPAVDSDNLFVGDWFGNLWDYRP